MVLASVDAEVTDEMKVCGKDFAIETVPVDILESEQAVRIYPCNHKFGRTCLEAWFSISKSNRCPNCNQELFPQRHFKLFLRKPTLAIRLEFANYIDQVCGDSETAAQIRANPMNDLNRLLIREFAMELWRREEFDVKYEYSNDSEADDEEAETEIENTGEEDTEDEGEDDDEDKDEDEDGDIGKADEMVTDTLETDDCPKTEYGFVGKA